MSSLLRGLPVALLALANFVTADAQEAATASVSRVTITAASLAEGSLIGANDQPEWTAHRRFAATRVYVLPPWQVEIEQWWKGKFTRQGTPEHLFQSEIEIGLPYRFQFDVYENIEHLAGTTRHAESQVEGRWALADWGKMPLNPTFYAEAKFNGPGPDAYEARLLLSEELVPRWNWGFNLFYEQQTGGERAREWGFSQAISYTVVDSKLSVGVEMNFENTTRRGARGDPAVEFLIGPSIQWRPTRGTHLDLVPLFGTTRDSPVVEPFIVFGVDLGRNPGGDEIQAPISGQSR